MISEEREGGMMHMFSFLPFITSQKKILTFWYPFWKCETLQSDRHFLIFFVTSMVVEIQPRVNYMREWDIYREEKWWFEHI